MSFNTAYITTSKYGTKDYTLGLDEIVISKEIDWNDDNRKDELVFGKYYATEEEDRNNINLYKLEYRSQFGFHLKPYNEHRPNLIGAMNNGVIAQIPFDICKQLQAFVGYPISEYMPVHDRYETQEQYDMNFR